jgi:ABC-type lipoprotein export system ATPase subunit
MSKYPRGSEWRKWDLHIHSTYSCEPSAKLSPQDIFESASANDIAVISITDHSNVDGLDVTLDVWENGTDSKGEKFSDNISFLPGVELKADAGRKGVHFLAVFPPQIPRKGYEQRVDKTFLKESFLSKIGCSESEIKSLGAGDYKNGIFKVAVNFEKTAKLVRSLGGIIIVHSGNKASSIETEISHSAVDAPPEELLNTLGPQKEKLMTEYVDICELPNWSSYHQKQKQFYLKAFDKPSVVFSDSHFTYENTCPTWIKADPTFEGLKQVLNEPHDRVCIQEPPNVLNHINQNKPNYIHSVTIEPTGSEQGWFNDTIPLNPNLVAVIGSKGTGKSALADIISLLGDTLQFAKFSFLQLQKFRNRKNGKASLFQAKMTWLDGETSGPIVLNEDPTPGNVEKVKYLPQNFIDEICTDLAITQDSQFYQELQGVIFSHLQEHERLGCDSLSELIEQESEETKQQIQNKIEKIAQVNSDIVEFQQKLSSESRSGLANKLAEKKRFVKQILKDRPRKTTTPAETKAAQNQQELLSEISKLQERADKLFEIKTLYEGERLTIGKKIGLANKLSEHLVWVTEKVEEYQETITELAKPIEIESEKLFKVQINKKLVHNRHDELCMIQLDLDKLLSKDEFSIEWELAPLEKNIQNLKDELSKPEKEYQEYLQHLKDWKKRVLEAYGAKNSPKKDTIHCLQIELKRLAAIPQLLVNLQKKRIDYVKKIYRLKTTLKNKFRHLHSPVQRFIEEHPIALRENFPLSFQVSIAEDGFLQNFFEYINQGKNGTFCGLEQGQQRVADVLDRTDFDQEESTISFLEEILANLVQDKRDGQSTEYAIDSQLKKNTTEEELLNMIFSLSYLKPIYNLQWDKKGIGLLSPGERGQLLLIFYLLIDQNNIPLVIDQPEENLDNQTVYQVLVPCIKVAKEKRQVILVTHNPNLAVVCDSEQIICVKMDKKNKNTITYTTGAIENPVINHKIVKILEGTEPAFRVRKSKYQFAGKQER